MTAGGARQRKVASRLQEIARDRRALRNAIDQFAGADDFAGAWASENPDEINRRDQVERPFERIVNDLQEIIELCEEEEVERGLVAPHATPGDEPGRWRRAALRGYLTRSQAQEWQLIARGRRRLQHHYADLPARRGAEIYERSQELLAALPRTAAGLGRWIETLWPANRS